MTSLYRKPSHSSAANVAAFSLIVLLMASCALPTQAKPASRLDAGALVSSLQARDLGTFISLRLSVTDEAGSTVIDQTWTSLDAADAVSVELESGRDYSLALELTNRDGDSADPRTWRYASTINLPAQGDLALDLDFPSLADWQDFAPQLDAIARLIGYFPGYQSGPLYEAFTQATLAAETAGAGNSASGDFSWTWTKTSSETLVTLTAARDIPLDGSSYVLLAGSSESFSSLPEAGGTTTWKLSGGAIHQVDVDYSGLNSSTIAKAMVNGWDFTEVMLGSGALSFTRPSDTAAASFMANDWRPIQRLFEQGDDPGSAKAAMYADQDSAWAESPIRTNGSGIAGNFSWSWSGSTSATSTTVISTSASNPVAGTSYTLKPGSFIHLDRTGTLRGEYFFDLSGGSIARMHLRWTQSITSDLPDIQSFQLSGHDFADYWLTVTYEENNNSAPNQDIFFKGTAPYNNSPYRAGYDFAGWYTDEALTQAWTPGTVATAPITLYAAWTQTLYNISFDSQGGSAVGSAQLPAGSLITAPTPPTRTYYAFNGWTLDPGGYYPWNFATDTVSGDLTLYAQWIAL